MKLVKVAFNILQALNQTPSKHTSNANDTHSHAYQSTSDDSSCHIPVRLVSSQAALLFILFYVWCKSKKGMCGQTAQHAGSQYIYIHTDTLSCEQCCLSLVKGYDGASITIKEVDNLSIF